MNTTPGPTTRARVRDPGPRLDRSRAARRRPLAARPPRRRRSRPSACAPTSVTSRTTRVHFFVGIGLRQRNRRCRHRRRPGGESAALYAGSGAIDGRDRSRSLVPAAVEAEEVDLVARRSLVRPLIDVERVREPDVVRAPEVPLAGTRSDRHPQRPRSNRSARGARAGTPPCSARSTLRIAPGRASWSSRRRGSTPSKSAQNAGFVRERGAERDRGVDAYVSLRIRRRRVPCVGRSPPSCGPARSSGTSSRAARETVERREQRARARKEEHDEPCQAES